MKFAVIGFSLVQLMLATTAAAYTPSPQSDSSYLCEQILDAAFYYTCASAGAFDSADCYMKSKSNFFEQDEYDIYWHAVCRRGGEREDICSLTDLPRRSCERVDCEGTRPEWTYTIGDHDGDPCP